MWPSGGDYDFNHVVLNHKEIALLNSDNLLEHTSTAKLGESPFKPFLMANKVREYEIHRPYNTTTHLGQNLVETSGMHVDADGNYISDIGYP